MPSFSSNLRFAGIALSLVVLVFSVPFHASAQPVIQKGPVDIIGLPINGEARFTVEATGEDLEYQWRLNGVNLPGATESALPLAKARVEDFGTYTVALTDRKGSTNSGPARLIPELRQVEGGDEFSKPFVIDGRNELDPQAGIFLTENKEATREPGEPDHAGRKGGKSIWFRWIATKNGVIKFSASGSGFDTLLAAYRGDSLDKLDPISLTASDDDRGGFFTSEIQFNALEGVEYAIAVDGYEGAFGHIVLRWLLDGSGGFLPQISSEPRNQVVGPDELVELGVDYEGGTALWLKHGQPTEETGKTYVIDKINEDHVGRYAVLISAQERHQVRTVPANIQINITDDKTDTNAFAHDKFLMAQTDRDPKGRTAIKGPPVAAASAGVSRGYTTTQIFSTVGSTKDPGEPNHAGVAGGASEWFVYSPPEAGTMNVNTDGSNYDTVVAVYTATGFGYDTFDLVGSNNRPGVNGNDRFRFQTEAGITYFIAVDGVGGASGTVKLNIHLGDPSEILSQPQSRTVGAGTNATFTVTASGTPAPSYQWYFNDVAIANATGSSYTRLGARTNHAGIYHVVVSNAVQAAKSDLVTLTVLNPPTIAVPPTNQTVAPGSTALFTVSATGSPTLRYQWRLGGVDLVGATSATLSITNVQSGNAGNYSVRVTNTVGSAISSDAVLTVHSAPAITAHPQSKTVAANGSVALLVSATGSPAPAYRWHKNGSLIATATASNLHISNFSVADEGSYFVVVSNSVGSVSSAVANLALNSPMRTSGFGRGTNGAFEISLIGEADTLYILQGTSNLTNWFPISSNSSPSGFVFLSDTNASASAFRFYRMLKE